MNSTHSKTPNTHLCHERELRGWSQEDLAEKVGTSQKVVSRWERGESTPLPYYRQKLCTLFGKNAVELGFLDEQSSEDHPREESAKNNTFVNDTVQLSLFELGVTDKLDSAESIINLAWEAWFASRPSVAARSVNTLLPSLEQIAYSPDLPGHTLRAKKLAIRAHGLLGSVCLDASQNNTALFHYMQAHRFAEEIHDVDLATTYLCLTGDVLRRQNDQSGALQHMEHARDVASHASHTTRGHILQLLAYTYGDTGQEAAFEHTISEATGLLAFSGEGIDTVQKEFIPFEVYEIRGKINRDLGKPLGALSYLELAEKSLNAADSVTPRWHALLEISRAQTYCDAGDIAVGIELAFQGFIMAYQCRSPHQMNRVRKLLRKLEKGPFRHHPRVQDLKNLLYETYMRME
jgi:transcriptional regulator with XRE-family HTH domain